MIYVLYLLVAATVVWLSVKASDYVDLLERKTTLSGAFIGGIMLSAVTSLPELFTSISATVLIDQPGLCLGNILGSDLFNLAALSVFVLVFFRPFQNATLAGSHRAVALLVFACYLVVVLNWSGVLNMSVLTISITSVCIVVLYALSVRYLAGDNGHSPEQEKAELEREVKGVESGLNVKQIAVRFVAVSVGIIAMSICITYVTDIIAERLSLGQGIAGALFLGVATSLPEVASTIALFRIGNFNIAFGNIIGSNIFNFVIMAVVDILYIRGSVYDFSDPQTVTLLLCGLAAMPFLWAMMKFRNKLTQIVCPIAILTCYGFFLIA